MPITCQTGLIWTWALFPHLPTWPCHTLAVGAAQHGMQGLVPSHIVLHSPYTLGGARPWMAGLLSFRPPSPACIDWWTELLKCHHTLPAVPPQGAPSRMYDQITWWNTRESAALNLHDFEAFFFGWRGNGIGLLFWWWTFVCSGHLEHWYLHHVPSHFVSHCLGKMYQSECGWSCLAWLWLWPLLAWATDWLVDRLCDRLDVAEVLSAVNTSIPCSVTMQLDMSIKRSMTPVSRLDSVTSLWLVGLSITFKSSWEGGDWGLLAAFVVLFLGVTVCEAPWNLFYFPGMVEKVAGRTKS